jgi:hypothetical protein
MDKITRTIDTLIHWLLWPFYTIGTWYDRVLIRVLGLDQYFLRDGFICHGRFRLEKIKVERIRTWQVIMEMGFDLIWFELDDGPGFRWRDHNEKLAGLLRKTMPGKGASDGI